MGNSANKQKTKAALILFFVAFCISNAISNYAQYQMSPTSARIMAEYGLTQMQFSSIFSAPMVPAIFFCIISGLLTDRYGFKFVMGFAVLMAFIGTLLRCFVSTYTGFWISMFCIGFVGAIFSANASKALSSVFGEENVSKYVGILFCTAFASIIISSSTSALFSSLKSLFICGAVVGAICLLAWVLFIPNDFRSKKNAKASEAAAAGTPGIKECLLAAVKNKYVWITGLALAFATGAQTVLGSSLAQALINGRAIEEVSAGFAITAVMVGQSLGALLTPMIAAKTGKFRITVIAAVIVSAICVSLAWRMGGLAGIYIIAVIAGFGIGSASGSLISVPVRIEGIGTKYGGTAGGIVAMIQLAGGVFLPTYVATAIAGSNYSLLFIIAGIFLVLTCVFVLLMPKYLDKKS